MTDIEKTKLNERKTKAPVPHTVEYWASEKPEAVALVEGDKSLTYGDWNALADAVAEGFARLGVEAGDVIVTRLQIRLEWAIIASAAAKLGCSILGLNWRLTPSEVNYVLSNSEAKVLVCDDADPAALLPAFEDVPLKLKVSLDVPADAFVSYEELFVADAPERISKGEAPLIIYTSGTTGLPKGVNMSPGEGADMQKIMEYYQSLAAARPQVPGDVVLISMPMHHGAGPALVRGTLASGNIGILQRRFDPEGTLQLMEHHKVTFWTGVPTMYKRINGLPDETLKKYDVSSVRSLGVGAAPVPASLKEWIRSFFGEVLHESYGATEVGMISDLAPEEQKIKPGSSGKPHRHVLVEIRDEDGNVLPAGESGEIWINTPVTIRNYVNADLLDSDTLDERGYFRVGDAAMLDEDGYIFITDRVKDMIISGGVNIYPAEIEAALIQHSDIQDVAVIGVPDEEFGEKVMAFVELKPDKSLTEDEVRDFAAEHLASYKRPRVIEFRDELPRNTMGKLLKKDLRAPFWEGRDRAV